MIFLYLTLLFLAPQDWFGPLLGLRVDYILYPLWITALVISGRSRYLLRVSWQDAVLLLFVAWLYLSALVNHSWGISGEYLFWYAKWALLYKLVAASLTSMGRIRRASLIIVLFAMVLSVESIQHMHDPNQLGWAGQSLAWISQSAVDAGVNGRTRWVSIFDGPGVFCVVFTLALPFLLQFLGRPFSIPRRAATAILLLPLGLAIYYTGSRGGFLTAMAIFALHYGARTRISVTKLAVVGLLLVGLFAAAPAYMTSMYDENRSAQHRVDMWIDGIEMVGMDPVFGIGRGHYADWTGRLVAHNSAIELAGETGLPGFVLWITMLLLAFKQLLAAHRSLEDPSDRSYTVALGIALAGYIVSSMFVTLELETLYFLLGMTAALGHQTGEPVRLTRRDVLSACSLGVAFLVSLRLFVAYYY